MEKINLIIDCDVYVYDDQFTLTPSKSYLNQECEIPVVIVGNKELSVAIEEFKKAIYSGLYIMTFLNKKIYTPEFIGVLK